MTNRILFSFLISLLIALPFFSGTTSLASMPAINRFKEGVAAVQGVWYDLDGNEAFSAVGDSFNGKKILSVTSYGGSAIACDADFCVKDEDGEKTSHIDIAWTSNRKFLMVNGNYYRSTKEPEYYESAHGVFLGMKKENALALLSLAPPGRNVFYAGYFMLALHDAGTAGDHDFRVRVVDGATYDGETLASSADSLCKVNNLVFSVAPWESGSLTASRVVALRFTPGGQGTAAAVEVVLLSSLPDDGESAAYCQLGRVEVPDSGSNVPRIIQDHTAGVAHLWWFFQCR